MTAVPSTSIDPGSARFQANRAQMQVLLDAMLDGQARVLHAEDESYVPHEPDQGRLPVRRRIDLLLDRDSPFLELAPLAGWGTDDHPGGALVLGVGIVQGTECLVAATDPVGTVTATPTAAVASSGPDPPSAPAATATATVKARRAHELAASNRLPLICLIDRGDGATAAINPDPALRRSFERLDAARIPLITLTFGTLPYESSVARHTGHRGDVTVTARDHDVDAIRVARQVVSHLNWRKGGPGPTAEASPPLLDADELLGLAAVDPDQPIDVRELIWRVVDGSRFDELEPLTGPQLVTGWASVGGFPIGVVADNGILFTDESDKGVRFIGLCNRRDIPILFVQSLAGYVFGTPHDEGGRIGNRARLVSAVDDSTVPHLVLMIGASPGADNGGVPAGAFRPRFVFSWPNHRPASTDPDDGTIDPRDTRTVLGIALSCIHSAPIHGAGSYDSDSPDGLRSGTGFFTGRSTRSEGRP